MKLLTFKFFLVFIYLISLGKSYATEQLILKNLVIHKNPKKLEKVNFQNVENEIISLNEFKNSLIIINFWATWCAPCIEEMPSLNKLQANSNFNNLQVIPINVGRDDIQKMKDFYKKLKLNNLKIYFDEEVTLPNQFLLRGLPTSIFINKKGEEFARIIGFINFENEKIIQWLKKYE